jgi:AraC-like DNA-binding protein
MKIRELLQEAVKAPTSHEQQLIRQYRQQGLSNVEIDKEMGKYKTWTTQVISHYMRDLIQQTHVGRLLTDQDVEKMWERLKELKNLKAVAQEFGVGKTAVRDRLDDMFGKEEVDKQITFLTDQDVEKMWKRLQELKNLRAVAQEFGVSKRTVRDRLDDMFGKAEVDKWVREIIPFSDYDKKAVKQMYASGMGATSIAAKLDPPRLAGVVSTFLSRLPEPEKTNLKNQYLANNSLLKSPQAATTNVYRAGRIDPTKRGTDWRVGKGYK